MGQAVQNIINRDEIVHAAYGDNTETIARLIPYLQERYRAAKNYLTTPYVDQQAAEKALFEIIEACNKSIAEILGITVDQLNK